MSGRLRWWRRRRSRKLALGGEATAAEHTGHEGGLTHAAMIGDAAPAVGRARATSMHSSTRRRPWPTSPGGCAEYELVAADKDVEIAPGVHFPAWTYNGTIPAR